MRTLLLAGIASLGLVGQVFAANVHVQGGHNETGGASNNTIVLTLGSNVASGNMVCGAFEGATGGLSVTSVTDDKGNTYTIADDILTQGFMEGTAFYRQNITNAPHIITVHLSGASPFLNIAADEYSGAGSSGLTAHAMQGQLNVGTGSNAVTSGSVTNGTAAALVCGTIMNQGNSTGTAGTGYTLGQSSAVGGDDFLYTEYKLSQATGSVAVTGTAGTAGDNWMSSIMLFSPPGGTQINSISLSKSTFVPNSASATVGTVTVTKSSGSFAGTLAVNGVNSCGFTITGTGPWTLAAGSAGCTPKNYTDFGIVATESGNTNSPFTWCGSTSGLTGCSQTGLAVEAQVVSSIPVFTTANTTFAANVPNAVVGSVSAVMNPTTPAAAGVWSITGTNSCGFHVSGTQILAKSAGCAAGSYTDWNLVFTPTNTDIAAFTQAEGATAAAPPAAYPIPLSYAPGASLGSLPVFLADRAYTVVGISGRVASAVVASGSDTVDVYMASDGSACTSSSTKLNSLTFNANTPLNTRQNLQVLSANIPSGAAVCLVQTGPDFPGNGKGIIQLMVQ